MLCIYLWIFLGGLCQKSSTGNLIDISWGHIHKAHVTLRQSKYFVRQPVNNNPLHTAPSTRAVTGPVEIHAFSTWN
jgi:hypothetical protein